MKQTLITVLVILAIGGTLVFLEARRTSPETIVKLAEKGATEKEMMDAVGGKHFSLTADEIVKMKGAGVPNSVILSMLHK